VLGWLFLLHYWLLSRVFVVPPIAVFWIESAFTDVVAEVERAVVSQSQGFGLVWLETTASFACLKRLRQRMFLPAPVVLSAQNVEWMIPRRQVPYIHDPLLRVGTRLQANVMRNFEGKAHRESTLAIHCSPQDAQLAKQFSADTRVVCVANGVDIQHYSPSPGKMSSLPTLVYTGNFDYAPNVDAAIRLAGSVLPLVQAVIPNARLVIAGRNAASLADRLPNSSWLTLASNPEDMRPILDEAWITVVPLRSGSGTRLKILEAMAMKVPVVSTAIGAEGLGAVDGDVILIRESPAAQAEAAVQLLSDPHARAELAERASAWVRERFSWDRLVQQAVEEVQQLVSCH
jgi:glycosyltransferase involved in cell wall biosynthesis